MIGNRSLIALAVAALVAVVAAVASQPREPGSVAQGAGEPVLAKLDRSTLQTVDRLTVTGANGEVRLKKGESGWRVANLDGYPAEKGRVQRALLQLNSLQKRAAKTANPDFYDQLELVAPGGDQGGKATRIVVQRGDKTLARLLKGKSYEPGFGERAGLYVRRAGQKRSWLAEGSLAALTPRPADWVDTQISDIPADKLARLEFRGGKRSAPLVFERADSDGKGPGKLVPAGPAAGLTIKNREPLQNAAGFLANLEFQTVAKAESVGGQAGATATFTTTDGLQVQARHRVADGQHWLTLSPARTDGASDKLADRVAQLNERWSGWAYRVEAETAKQLLLTRKALRQAPDS